jgi:hypothetical protein
LRLGAYLGTLGVLALLGGRLVAALPLGHEEDTPQVVAQWAAAGHLQPAFDLASADSDGKTLTYEVLRHPAGGRKDILDGPAGPGGVPLTRIEIYRPGAELVWSAATRNDLAAQLAPAGWSGGEPAGMLDSKFGPVALMRFAQPQDRAVSGASVSAAATASAGCTGFMASFPEGAEASRLRLSGWDCRGDQPAAQRADLGCMLDRLTLLTAGGDARLAARFARAELHRRGCGEAAQASATTWISSPDGPLLHGAVAVDAAGRPAS